MSEEWRPKDPYVISYAMESLRDNLNRIKDDLGCPDKFIAQLLRRMADSIDDQSKDGCDCD